jgi:hypothetical protein
MTYDYYPSKGLNLYKIFLYLLCYHRSLDLVTTPSLNHYHKPRQLTSTVEQA